MYKRQVAGLLFIVGVRERARRGVAGASGHAPARTRARTGRARGGCKKTALVDQKPAHDDARATRERRAMTRDDADGGERDDLYDALGVARDATKTEVRARRREDDATRTMDAFR